MNNVTNWVFDLDNTLYKAECGLFDKVHVLMGRYIEEKLGLASRRSSGSSIKILSSVWNHSSRINDGTPD